MKKTQQRKTLGITVGLLVLIIGATAVFGQIEGEAREVCAEVYDPYILVSGILGLSEDELDAQLEEGKTLAQIARDLSIDPDSLVEAVRQADSAETDLALAEGEIDEAEAAEWKDFGYAYAVEFVYLPFEELFWLDLDEFGEFDNFSEFGEFGDFDEFSTFGTELLGFFPYDMAIESQRTMAYSLLDHGVEPEVVVDSIIDAEESLLSEVLGFIVALFEFDMDDVDYGYAEDDWEDEIIGVVSETLGIDEDEAWLALDEGQTLASLAQGKGVDPGVLIDQLMAEEEAWITELIADGELSEAEAKEWRVESQEYVDEIVNEPWF